MEVKLPGKRKTPNHVTIRQQDHQVLKPGAPQKPASLDVAAFGALTQEEKTQRREDYAKWKEANPGRKLKSANWLTGTLERNLKVPIVGKTFLIDTGADRYD